MHRALRWSCTATWVALAALVVLAWARPASAATRRIVVAVGHNTGADGRAPLRFAEEDAGKFADVMVDLGEVAPSDVFLVQGKGSSVVHAALDQATAAVGRARANPEDRVVLLFFYSGHSDGQTIELGRERLSYAELKAWLASTGADVRIAIVDSCKSGALVLPKGGARGPAFNVTMVDDLVASGEAFLTSAAADEDALESAEIRGSFFTHHLVSGLRGAADASGDGVVTLSEAYEYAFNHTVTSTAQAGAPPQHPTYDYRVAGRGELRLTEVTRRSAVLEMPEDFQRALIVQPRRDQVIAELGAGTTRRVAVAPGEYGVRLWRAGHTSVGRIKVGAGQIVSLTWEQLTPTEPVAIVAPKGGRTEEPTVVEPALLPAQQAEWDRLSLSVDALDQLYAGSHEHHIDQREALERMNQAALLKQYDDELTTERWMIWGGVGVGVGMIIIDRAEASSCADEVAKISVDNLMIPGCVGTVDTLNQVTTVAVLGGIALAIVGLVRHPEPVHGRELKALVDDHNRRLRLRLVDPSAAPPAPPAAAKPGVRLSGWLRSGDRSTGGLALTGQF